MTPVVSSRALEMVNKVGVHGNEMGYLPERIPIPNDTNERTLNHDSHVDPSEECPDRNGKMGAKKWSTSRRDRRGDGRPT